MAGVADEACGWQGNGQPETVLAEDKDVAIEGVHTQIGTTQRYAHLIYSPLRAGVNEVGEILEILKPRLKVMGA